MSEIQKILVVGSGTMGAQIAMVCALAGYQSTVQDISAASLERAERELRERMSAQVVKGRKSAEEVAAAFERLSFTSDLRAGGTGADFAIEAATEQLDIKREIFAKLGQVTPPHAILTTNSSTLGSSQVAEASGRPERVCNLHFFNPALIMRAVEIVRHPDTSDETIARAAELAKRLGKHPVLLEKEIPGFVANRLMGAVREEALSLYADGVASIADIDTAARDALGYPMGPFQLMDLVGLDVTVLIRKAAYEQTGDPKELPHSLLVELVEEGHYGRKTGKGWYEYADA